MALVKIKRNVFQYLGKQYDQGEEIEIDDAHARIFVALGHVEYVSRSTQSSSNNTYATKDMKSQDTLKTVIVAEDGKEITAKNDTKKVTKKKVPAKKV